MDVVELEKEVNKNSEDIKKYGYNQDKVRQDIATIRRTISVVNSIRSKWELGNNFNELSASIDRTPVFVIPNDDKTIHEAVEYYKTNQSRDNIFNCKLPFKKCIIYGFGIACVVQLKSNQFLAAGYLHGRDIGRPLSYFACYEFVKNNEHTFADVHDGSNGLLMHNVLEMAGYYVAYLSRFIDEFETISIENPKEVQASRAKHGKAPLPDIRVLTGVKKVYIEKLVKGTHASPEPHDRRGTWCISKLGKRYWRSEAKVKGGAQAAKITIIDPITNEGNYD